MNANEQQTLYLPAGYVLSVAAASGASGSAIRLAKLPGGGGAQSITAINPGETSKFGPYAQTERFNIICTAGSLTISSLVPTPDMDGTLSGNSDNVVPSQKAVKTYVDAQTAALLPLLDALTYKGVISSLAKFPAASKGDVYKITAAGAIGGTGPTVAIGDMVICNTDSTAEGTYAEVGVKWDIIPATNIDSLSDLIAASEENDVIVAGPSPFAWVKKTIAQFKTILGLGSAAYTASTAYDAAGTAAELVAGKADKVAAAPDPTGYLAEFDASGNLVKSSALSANVHASGSDNQDLSGYAPLANPVFTGAMAIPEKTPVNATATTLAIPAADIAVLENGDTVGFDESTFTMAAAPGAGEFSNAAGLAALFDALEGWTGAESDGAVSAVSVALGAAQNGQIATITHLGATTSGGSEVAKATATIAAAEIARLAVGDQVTFDGSTFTKAAATSVPANEFADTAGLISCIDGMAAWTAAASGSDIKVDAAENGEASNGKAINLIYKRTSAGAVNGTVGVANETCADGTNLYHCIATNTVADANWRKVALGSAF